MAIGVLNLIKNIDLAHLSPLFHIFFVFLPSILGNEDMDYNQNIVGRKYEQDILQACMESPKAEFIAVYGRRRIGKTFGSPVKVCGLGIDLH